jgi:hypothetical protein
MSGKRGWNATLVVGILAIAAGTVLLLDRLGLINAAHVFRLWPLILIALGINTLIQNRGRRGLVGRIETGRPGYLVGGGRGHVMGGGMLILVGVLNLLFTFGYFGWSQLWPVLIIGFGLLMVWESFQPGTNKTAVATADGSAHSVFASVEKTIVSRDFKEATIESVFGSTELDFHQAEMAGDKAYLNVNSVFGSVEIFVPDHWNVMIEANAVFGSCENKTRPPLPSPTPKTLIIRGDAVFGSIEVKN